MSDYELSKALEVVKGRVYYIAVRAHPRPRPDCHFFCIDDTLVYWNFFLDFGPLNLGQTYRFCTILHTLLTSKEYQNLRIYYYSSTDPHKRTNAAWLVSAYRMMYMGLTPEQVRQLGAVTAGWGIPRHSTAARPALATVPFSLEAACQLGDAMLAHPHPTLALHRGRHA